MKISVVQLILMILLVAPLASAKSSTGEELLGQWNFVSCDGDVTHHKDVLTVEKVKNGLKMRQKQIEGPMVDRVFYFYSNAYWDGSFTSDKKSSKQLRRSMTTKIIGGVPMVTTHWAPLTNGGKREFLSSAVIQYQAVGKSEMKMVSIGSTISKKGTQSFTANCLYKKAQKVTSL